MRKRFINLLSCLLVVFLFFSISALAQYPEKPITIIVMYSPGGATDIFVRGLQPGLEEALGVDVIVKNVVGGGGAVGFSEAMAAKPDGYTVTIPNNALFTLEGMGYVPFSYKDFDMLGRVIVEDYSFSANSDLPWKNMKEFAEAAKANPGKYKVGFAGIGSSTHIISIAVEKALNIDVKQIPYDGGAKSMAACMGGHIDALVQTPGEVISGVEAGNLKFLAALGYERAKIMLEIPTLHEQGIDFAVTQWRGIGAPKGVSEEVKEVWAEAIKKAVKDPMFLQAAENQGLTISPLFGEELEKYVDEMANIFIPIAQEIKQK